MVLNSITQNTFVNGEFQLRLLLARYHEFQQSLYSIWDPLQTRINESGHLGQKTPIYALECY